ncbi:MAG: hypothetical protein HFI39_10445 [Lachnospiraceae bacterium]|nr:hypothetical protein [Lachnospiraceae bacterium]
MKKRKYFLIIGILFLCMIFGIICYKQAITEKVLKQTWEQLSKSERYEAVGSWTDGKVEKIIIQEGNTRYFVEESYYGEPVLLVTFTSSRREVIGDVEKIVDAASGRIVGGSFRD